MNKFTLNPRRMPLATRLTLLVMVIAVPLLVLNAYALIDGAVRRIKLQSEDHLALTNTGLREGLKIWLDANQQMLNQLAGNQVIISMDPAAQKALLEQASKAYPQIFLLHTINLDGFDVARNDAEANRDYSDREYFTRVKSGERAVGSQVLTSRTTGQPSLALSAPIVNPQGQLVGVLALAADLDQISRQVAASKVGETGYSYVVDDLGRVVAHPDAATTAELRDLSAYPPVAALSGGRSGLYTFTVENGVEWVASLERLSNGWGVIVQQQTNEANLSWQQFRAMGRWITVIAALALLLLVGYFVRRSLLPVQRLTETARAISAGDLARRAPATRYDDEVGQLTMAFNQMTAKLQASLEGLEQQVSARTRALETSTDVSQHLSTILDPGELIKAVVDEIQQAFGYYYVQIYLWDEVQQNLLLAGGTGQAGQAMLERGHQVARGKGLVGRAADSNQAVLVADTAADPGWLRNPLLPETRAEVAVPVAVAGQVLGVLDVQADRVGGLDNDAVNLLQSLANQVGVAIQNARQHATTQAALQEVTLFRQFVEGAGQGMALGAGNQAIYVNPAFRNMLGLGDLHQLVGQSFMSLYPPAFGQRLRSEISPVIASEGRWTGELTMLAVDGREIPTLAHVFLIPTAQPGQPDFTAVIVTDMTERQKAQETLRKQAGDLERVSQISASVSAILDPVELLQQVADQTRTQFGLYFVDIYLFNPAGDALVMAAGSDERGRKMKQRGFEIPLDHPDSLIARAARTRQGVVVNDVRMSAFLAHDLLPDTQSEMSIPLLAGGELLGVLDVQADQPGRFSDADVSINTALATQIAVALKNAYQYQQTRQSEQLVRTIIDSTPDWIFIKDRQRRYRLVNRSYADLLRRTPEEMLEKSDAELGLDAAEAGDVRARERYAAWQEDERAMRSGKPLETPLVEFTLYGGEKRFFSVFRVPLKDDQERVWGVLDFARDITERERLRQETEERLNEVNALYRVVNREAWQGFLQSQARQTAFFFDQSDVSPAETQWLEETRPALAGEQAGRGPVTVAPLSLRGNVIGALAVEVDPQKPLTADELDLLNEMSDQVALALESARLFEQTQQALGTTETLYQGSEQVVRAGSLDDVLRAVVETTPLRQFERGSLVLFDQPQVDRPGSKGILATLWEKSGQPSPIPAGSVFTTDQFPIVHLIQRDQPFFISDVAADERLKDMAREMLLALGRSMAVFPLVAGGQWIGWVTVMSAEPVRMTEEQIRQVQSLMGQAAAVVQSLHLLEETQQRARYEATLRQVTSRVRASTDPDAVLRTAAREVGSLLGRNVVIRLGTSGAGHSQTPPAAGNGNGHGTEVDQ